MLTETVSWGEFLDLFHWEQGQHVTMLGTTGYGKSTTIRKILHLRDWSVFFATKRKDDTVDKLERQGYKVQQHFRPEVTNRIILKPRMDPDSDSEIKREFNAAMNEIFWMGAWCMVWDEAAFLSSPPPGGLGMQYKMNKMLMQGRSLGISIVTASQRPAFIPTYAYDMATHFFFWKMKLSSDVTKAAALGGLDMSEMIGTIRSLPKYHFLYYNKDTDLSVITKPEV